MMDIQTLQKNPGLYKVSTKCTLLRCFQDRNINIHQIVLNGNEYREYISLCDLLKIKNVGWKLIRKAIEFNHVLYI